MGLEARTYEQLEKMAIRIKKKYEYIIYKYMECN